jgi:hypothetical protein
LSMTGDYQSELILVFYESYIKSLNDFTCVKSVEFPMTNADFWRSRFLYFSEFRRQVCYLLPGDRGTRPLGTHSILTHVFIYWTTFCCLDDVSERKNTWI